MLQIGNDKIKDIYVGSDKIKEIYYGSEKVWGEIASIQDGYWVHIDTGVKTYFDADADFITDGIMSSPPWAYDCSEVQIPTGVIGLGNDCFYGCTFITSITLPEGLTSLGDMCFASCTSLTSITLPEGVTSIGEGCFQESTSLTSITLPESVTSLGMMCFAICDALTSITLPESVTSLGMYCFYLCPSLTLATVLPAIPPSLGDGAFDFTHASFNIKVRSPYVDDYKTATNWISYADKISAIPDGYWVHKDTGIKTYFGLDDPSMDGEAMNSPSWKEDCSEVNIPVGVIYLQPYCFSGCESLTSITLPEGVTYLGDICFYQCNSLTSVTLPESVRYLERSCFGRCSSLTAITLPESVEYLGDECFAYCSSLTTVTVLPATPPTLGYEGFENVHTSFRIKVRPPYVNDYKTATNWTEYESIISAI